MRGSLLSTFAVLCVASRASAQAVPPAPTGPTPVGQSTPAPAPQPTPVATAPATPPAGPASPAPAVTPPPAGTAAPPSTPYPYPGYSPYPGYPAQAPAPYYPGYPGQVYAPPTDSRPRFLPYHPGEPAPPGYRYDEQMRRGPVVAGAITAGVPYLLGLLVASGEHFTNKRGFLVMPTLGPWLTLLTRDSTCARSVPISECNEDYATRMVLTIDGLLQTAGTILIASGVFNPRKRYVLEQWGALYVSPHLSRSGLGVSAVGRF